MTQNSSAYLFWRDGQLAEAGKLIFEQVPAEERGQWAAGVLGLALKFTPVSTRQIRELRWISRWRCLWFTAHAQFEAIRDRTLKLDKKRQKGVLAREDQIRHVLCLLAEDTAKVLYNATDPGPSAFDEDAGWYILPTLHRLLELCQDDRFWKEAESLLFGPDVQ